MTSLLARYQEGNDRQRGLGKQVGEGLSLGMVVLSGDLFMHWMGVGDKRVFQGQTVQWKHTWALNRKQWQGSKGAGEEGSEEKGERIPVHQPEIKRNKFGIRLKRC